MSVLPLLNMTRGRRRRFRVFEVEFFKGAVGSVVSGASPRTLEDVRNTDLHLASTLAATD